MLRSQLHGGVEVSTDKGSAATGMSANTQQLSQAGVQLVFGDSGQTVNS